MRGRKVKLKFELTPDERNEVKYLLSKGENSVRVIKRAMVLNYFDKGLVSTEVAKYVGVTAETARRIGWNYVKGDLNQALYDKPRPGKERALTTKQSNEIIALVCSDPPEGYAKWSVRLLTQEVIKNGIVETVGRETIRVLLKNHDLKPWREKNVVHK